ncbi:unnamed protein product [Effrenium voratum]|uniref:MBD domain-containing protein n=1 Tax=Effrenium voratum TaxID=2562239 RepID=A0AA36MHN4_9DINO|nr:unnamed protein product [Effrenium voratum]
MRDPRAKIPIFPKDPVCRNFYAELLRWPSRYRDYYCCERPADAAIACGKPDWKGCRNHLWDLSSFGEEEVRRLCYSIRDVLEMKGMFYMGRVRRSLRVAFHRKHPGECMPNAPLRALGYTSAGGCFANIRSGKPLSSLMKIGYVPGGNVYSNKIVLMDEAHNLVRSQTQYAEQLQRLRRLLYEAKHLVLAGFTGTPILSEPSEGRQLLDIVKGCLAPEGDEGFLSSFPMRPQPLFPISLPRGLPDGALTLQRKKQLVRKMEMKGEALKVYDLKRRLGLPSRRLRAYCNVSIFHAAFHDGKAGSKARILAYPEDCCPKLLGIAQAVLASEQKAVIMIGRTSGYVVMLELMKHLASQADPPVGVATMNELSEFNHCSNIRGEIYRVLVADSLQCSEGVSFLSVRRTFLADVPVAPSGFIQQTGRAIRMYGHRGLPEEEQTVTTQLFVSILPKWMRSSSLACWALRAQKKHSSGKEVEKRARILTARMNRAGISSLEDLKARLDAHGARRQRSRENLSAEDVLTFLEQNGLWEEARLLRSADKKDKEKAQAAEETQALQNGASRESLRGESTELLKGGTLEEDEFANALANMLEEELPEEERQQEMEALKEEQDADDVDGEEGKKAKPLPPAPFASQAVATLAMSPEQVAQCLTETLQALRAALREAEKKSEKEKEPHRQSAEEFLAEDFGRALAESLGAADAAETSAAPSERGAEAVPVAEAAAKEPHRQSAEEFLAEDFGRALAESLGAADAAETSAAPSERGAEAVPVAEAAVKEPHRQSAEEFLAEDFGRALAESLGAADAAETSAAPSERGAEAVPVAEAAAKADVEMPENDVQLAGSQEQAWRAPLVAVLEKSRRCAAFLGAARTALPNLDPALHDFNTLTLHQARGLRDEVAKVEKVETLRMAVAMIKEVKTMIADMQAPRSGSSASLPAASSVAVAGAAEPSASAPEAAASVPLAAAAVTAGAESEMRENGAKDGDEPMPPEREAHAPNTETPQAATQPQEAEASQPAPAPEATSAVQPTQLTPEERKARELAWRRRLARAFKELRRSEHAKAALEVAAPGLMEKTVAAEAKALETKETPEEEEEDSDLLSLGLGPEHVKRLHDELARLLEQAEKGAAKPRAMVRAMQMLFLADSASEAIASLKPETADEEALNQLTERTEEFAPALEAMRSLAVDKDVFAHLAEDLAEEHGEVHESESEASDLNKELVKKNEPAPVVLPEGWRMEWVKRKKKEMREFLDPEGNRYRTVREVRAALLEHEARQAALQAAKARQEALAAAPKRRRLRGKSSSQLFDMADPALGGTPASAPGPNPPAEDDFAEDLLKALGMEAEAPPAPAPPAPPAPPDQAESTLQTGLKVRLTELGQMGRLGDRNADGCWECFLEVGGKVMAKESDFELADPSVAKRKANPPPARRVRARGRGKAEVAPSQLGEDSD